MEIVSKIQSLSDAELCKKLSQFRQAEQDALSDLLLHLCELEKRKHYLDLGFSSLYSYLTLALGYSETSALRRIAAARVMTKSPELYWKVREGKLSLSAVVEIAKVRDTETQRGLLQSAEGQSRRDVQKLVVPHLPPSAPKKERTQIRNVARTQGAAPLFDSQGTEITPPPAEVMYGVYMEFSEKTMKRLAEAKALVGGGKNSEVVDTALALLIEKLSPKKREERRAKRAAKKAEKERKAATAAQKTKNETPKTVETPSRPARRISRHIPDALRDKIIIRDEARCTFIGPDGRRCSETHHLQVDHVQLFSFGGRHTEENLRLLCRPHNQLMAERALGKETMQRMRARK